MYTECFRWALTEEFVWKNLPNGWRFQMTRVGPSNESRRPSVNEDTFVDQITNGSCYADQFVQGSDLHEYVD